METELWDNISSCAQVLGTLFLVEWKPGETDSVFDELKAFSFDEWPFGGGNGAIAQAEALIHEGLSGTPKELAREYRRLFVGPEHFNAPAWGSVYLDKDQILFGLTTLELRQWMHTHDIVVNGNKREPEDHIGKMLLLLAWLASVSPELVNEFLAEHLMPWAPRYLTHLREDARQPLYLGLAVLTETTLADIVSELNVAVNKKPLYF
jgi:TorA maturation chaperone TorD